MPQAPAVKGRGPHDGDATLLGLRNETASPIHNMTVFNHTDASPAHNHTAPGPRNDTLAGSPKRGGPAGGRHGRAAKPAATTPKPRPTVAHNTTRDVPAYNISHDGGHGAPNITGDAHNTTHNDTALGHAWNASLPEPARNATRPATTRPAGTAKPTAKPTAKHARRGAKGGPAGHGAGGDLHNETHSGFGNATHDGDGDGHNSTLGAHNATFGDVHNDTAAHAPGGRDGAGDGAGSVPKGNGGKGGHGRRAAKGGRVTVTAVPVTVVGDTRTHATHAHVAGSTNAAKTAHTKVPHGTTTAAV